jgi:hypothetical protein
MEENTKSSEVNWEKIGVYIAIMAGFLTMMFYVVEMKVDIAKLQVKVENLDIKK